MIFLLLYIQESSVITCQQLIQRQRKKEEQHCMSTTFIEKISKAMSLQNPDIAILCSRFH